LRLDKPWIAIELALMPFLLTQPNPKNKKIMKVKCGSQLNSDLTSIKPKEYPISRN